MRIHTRVVTVGLVFSLCSTVQANKYGSVEPIANPAVIDTTPLRDQPLRVREAFAERLLQCGVVSQVVDALSATRAITTINNLNTSFAVGAGGFAGETNPSYVYTVIGEGPNAASEDDVRVLTDSLGYVLSQGSAFLLDSSDPDGFDFTANFVVLNFARPPSIAVSAALFRLVGRIDEELFETDTSGYTQFGRAYLSLQSAVAGPAVHRRLCQSGTDLRSGVHAGGQRNAYAVPGRRRVSPATTGRCSRAGRTTCHEFQPGAIGRWAASVRSCSE